LPIQPDNTTADDMELSPAQNLEGGKYTMGIYIMYLSVPASNSFAATQESKRVEKRFDAKTPEQISRNFLRWRDRTIQGVNTIGTHWPVRTRGRICGELMYDGSYWPANTRDPRPCDIVDDALAERFRTLSAHSDEYKAGVRAALEWRVMRAPMGCPYPLGSVYADAFVYGLEEGRRLSVGLPDALDKRKAEVAADGGAHPLRV
jgi:hypothetical protein